MDKEKVREIFHDQIDRNGKVYEHINKLNEMFNCKE